MLSEQVARLAARGEWKDLSDFFEALEHYASRRELHVARMVAVGFLLDLIEDLELIEADLRQCFNRLGSASRKAWHEAYRDGHGGAEWPNS